MIELYKNYKKRIMQIQFCQKKYQKYLPKIVHNQIVSKMHILCNVPSPKLHIPPHLPPHLSAMSRWYQHKSSVGGQ